ncbi:hypothetical protein GGR51DRAFT_544225 [Nemania sp. FL0031]|nr:hypothetical protein GGR51DRAFT_544225 [Nemania sp. FL0031]
MEKTRSACLSTVWRRFGRDRQLSPILLELKGAVEMLEMNQDFQCSRKLRDLKKKVSPSRGAYSNADLAKFFQGNIEGWKSATKSVDISTKCAIVGVIIELEAGGSIRVEIYLETDFEAACNELGNHLLSCSTSIEGIFHESTSDLGTIRLDTNAKDPAPLILWVCHNVFVRAELRPLDSESSGADSPDRFHRLMKKMFQYILDGCLPERQDLTQPEILKSSMKDFAYVGETFDVCIATDPDRFCKVECDDNVRLIISSSFIFNCRSKQIAPSGLLKRNPVDLCNPQSLGLTSYLTDNRDLAYRNSFMWITRSKTLVTPLPSRPWKKATLLFTSTLPILTLSTLLVSISRFK